MPSGTHTLEGLDLRDGIDTPICACPRDWDEASFPAPPLEHLDGDSQHLRSLGDRNRVFHEHYDTQLRSEYLSRKTSLSTLC
jgi:hypothetical protein